MEQSCKHLVTSISLKPGMMNFYTIPLWHNIHSIYPQHEINDELKKMIKLDFLVLEGRNLFLRMIVT